MKRLRIVRWLQGYGFETEIVQSVTRVDDGARIVYYLLDSEGLKYQAPGSNEVAVKVKNVDTYPFDRK